MSETNWERSRFGEFDFSVEASTEVRFGSQGNS
jgi:hypothetical protein